MFESFTDIDFDEGLLSSVKVNGEEAKSSAKHSKELSLTPVQKKSKPNDNDQPSKKVLQPNNPPKVSPQPFSRGIKRKFPGPAGILPGRKDKTVLLQADQNFDENSSQEHLSFCSQKSYDEFLEGAWIQMQNDFSLSEPFLPDKYNISWIKSQARLNKLNNQKAPFLAAIIETLEVFEGKIPTVNVTLKDKSGDIEATILHNLYEEYSNHLTVGSVLILKQFGVLTPRYQSIYYITITPKNLVSIYSHNKIKGTNEYTNSKINVQDVTVNQIVTSVNDVELLNKTRRDVSCDVQRKLFTSNPILHPIIKSNPQINFMQVSNNNRSVSDCSGSGESSKKQINNKFSKEPAVEKKKFNFKHIENKKQNPNIFETDYNDINLFFDDDLEFPDNFEETVLKPNPSAIKEVDSLEVPNNIRKPVLNLKESNHRTFEEAKKPKEAAIVNNNCSQIPVQVSEESKDWENWLENVDANDIFGDF